MSPDLRISLVKELEAIKRLQSKISLSGGFSGLFVSILLIVLTHPSLAIYLEPRLEYAWVNLVLFLLAWIFFSHSLYIILRYKMNKSFQLIYEALLSNKEARQPN